MIAGLKPYPAYKDSGVPWLGEVPAHWEVAVVKRHYTIQLGKMLQNRRHTPDDVEIPYLKAQHVQWFSVRTTDAPKMWASQNDVGQFGIAPGDLLVCEGGEGGRCGILKQEGDGYIIQNALHRVRPREQSRNDFLQYVMSAVAAAGWFDALNDKATIAHFTREKFGALRVPIPLLPEQTAIVRFLDHADRRIQRYIRAKQKLIALLEEQKQAIIHQAVTGRIDVRTGQPYPAYKPSGVEWLGDVPAHWEVRPLKAFSNLFGRIGFRGYSTSDLVEPGEGAITLSPSNLRNSQMNYSKCSFLSWSKYDESPEIQVHDGDILFVKTGATYGKTAIVSNLPEKATINPQLLVIKDIEADTTFVEWALTSPTLKAQIETVVIGGTIPTISQSKIGRLRFALPSTGEQQEIVSRVSKDYAPIDITIVRANHEIELLREYRTRLIADVVTGKLDVREAAAALPEADPLAAEDTLDDPLAAAEPEADNGQEPSDVEH